MLTVGLEVTEDQLLKNNLVYACLFDGIQVWKKDLDNFSREIFVFFVGEKISKIYKKECGKWKEIEEI